MEHNLEYKIPPKYINYKKRHNLKFGNTEMLSEESFKIMSNIECYYCGKLGPSGIDRIDNNIGYIENNCVPCCKHCNYVKGDLSIENFNIWKERFVKKQTKLL